WTLHVAGLCIWASDAPAMPNCRKQRSRAASTSLPSSGDLLCAVTDRPEHLIALRAWRATEEGGAKKRVHVFPDDLAYFGNLEETAERRFSDQCIAVRQALRVAHSGRKEIPGRLVLVLPYNLVRGWVDLDCSRIRH